MPGSDLRRGGRGALEPGGGLQWPASTRHRPAISGGSRPDPARCHDPAVPSTAPTIRFSSSTTVAQSRPRPSRGLLTAAANPSPRTAGDPHKPAENLPGQIPNPARIRRHARRSRRATPAHPTSRATQPWRSPTSAASITGWPSKNPRISRLFNFPAHGDRGRWRCVRQAVRRVRSAAGARRRERSPARRWGCARRGCGR